MVNGRSNAAIREPAVPIHDSPFTIHGHFGTSFAFEPGSAAAPGAAGSSVIVGWPAGTPGAGAGAGLPGAGCVAITPRCSGFRVE
jgi:hypothetical protein